MFVVESCAAVRWFAFVVGGCRSGSEACVGMNGAGLTGIKAAFAERCDRNVDYSLFPGADLVQMHAVLFGDFRE